MPEPDPRLSPAERLVRETLVEEDIGRPLTERARQRQRSVESYLRGEVMPRYMQRAAQIARSEREHERRLAAAHAELRDQHAGDPAAFTARWRAIAEAWDFRAHNDLVREHNEWYPIERDLPMNPRTGEYVLVAGRSYRRDELDAAWILRRFGG